jgi:hypothetical protein
MRSAGVPTSYMTRISPPATSASGAFGSATRGRGFCQRRTTTAARGGGTDGNEGGETKRG